MEDLIGPEAKSIASMLKLTGLPNEYELNKAFEFYCSLTQEQWRNRHREGLIYAKYWKKLIQHFTKEHFKYLCHINGREN